MVYNKQFPWIWVMLLFHYNIMSQTVLEYPADSMIIYDSLPDQILEPCDAPIIFSNAENGMFKTYSDELKHLGVQFRNGVTNYVYNPVLSFPEPDSLCREQSFFDRSWFSSPILGVHGRGTKVIFRGPVFKGDNTYAKTSIALFDHGHFVFGKDVVVDLVFPRYGNYTRQMWIFGDGTGVFELEEGFVADRSQMGTANVSFGSVRLSNVIFITHNSEAIPHYYMADDDNPDLVLRNAHLVFENEPGGKWIVKTHDQSYEGGIQVFTHCRIKTEKDLLLNGFVNHWPNKDYSDYGGIVFYKDSLQLEKTGTGKLTFDCDMFFNPGSELKVIEGEVVFKRDISNETAFSPPKVSHGNHLSVVLENKSVLVVQSDTLHLDRLVLGSEGKLHISAGSHLVTNQVEINGTIVIDLLKVHEEKRFQIFETPPGISDSQVTFINNHSNLQIDISQLSIDGSFTVF